MPPSRLLPHPSCNRKGKVAAQAISSIFLLSGLSFAQQYTVSTVAGGAPPATPVGATTISVGNTNRVTVDSAGNLYFSSSLNCVFEISTSGTLTLIAGNSRAGYSGDGGPATQAQLNSPNGLAIDSSGDLFIADTGNNVVREITPNGIITTFAGNGTVGYSGNLGPATQAQLHGPAGVAVDSSGDVYIADSANNVIREVSPDGTITTIAGTGYAYYSGDGGNPIVADLNNPQDVAVGPDGGIYIADTNNQYIREVVAGSINYVAGSGAAGYAGDGGSATAATTNGGPGVALYNPMAIVFDSAGNYYIADSGNNRIRKVIVKGYITDTVASAGTIYTVAGDGVQGFAGDGGPATQASLNQPTGVVVDSQGNIYIADNANARIRKVPSSSTITTIGGNGILSYSGNGGPATAAQLNAPEGVSASNGTIFIADSQNGVVRMVNQGVITGVSGGSFQVPRGVATDSAGNAYVADPPANRVWKIGTNGSVTAFAGTGSQGYSGDGGPATSALLNAPTSVAVDGAGNVYVDDFSNQRIREVSSDGTINTVAGNGQQGYSGDGGPAILASFNDPLGIAADAAGNLYIADSNNNVIREVTVDGTVNTIAGNGLTGFAGDGGPALKAQITSPSAVAVDAFDNLYFIDGTARVRAIFSGTVTTIAGNGTIGYSGDAGVATKAQFNAPVGLSVDASGNLYVADTGNNAVRLLQVAAPGVTLSAVTNAASNQVGPVAPGEIVVFYGSGLGPSQLQTYQLASNGLVPTSLAGTSVSFNGIAAPVLYASPNQVAAVAPFELSGPNVQIVIENQNQIIGPLSEPIATAAPGIFTTSSSGQGQAVAFNQNLSVNSATNPAAPGSLISLYLTGGGQTSPTSTDGSLASPPLPLLTLPVAVTIGGQQAQVSFAGGAPGQVAGMVELTVEVPSGIQPGNAVPVTVQIGSVSAQSGVTVAIGQ
jgi:trimeric autotransporter adhesin